MRQNPVKNWDTTSHLGVDENGMGPLLGPLVVTAIRATVEPHAAAEVARRARGDMASRLGDSKGLVAFGETTLGEAWARAVLAREGGPAPRNPAELIARLSLDDEPALRAPCPSHHVDMCWSELGEAFRASDALVATCLGDLDHLDSLGMRIEDARVIVLCNQRLNEAAARGVSRFTADLHAMERHALSARERSGQEVLATCGKVGGFGFYGPHFGPLGGHLHAALEEGRARSSYQFPGVGRLVFLRDADATHRLVGLASLVGKWVRDHLTARVVRYLQRHDEALPSASGYHDPVTLRLVASSRDLRARLNVHAACFERGVRTKK